MSKYRSIRASAGIRDFAFCCPVCRPILERTHLLPPYSGWNTVLPWRWRQRIPLKRWCLPTKQHSAVRENSSLRYRELWYKVIGTRTWPLHFHPVRAVSGSLPPCTLVVWCLDTGATSVSTVCYLLLLLAETVLWHIRSKQKLWSHNSRPLLGSGPWTTTEQRCFLRCLCLDVVIRTS
jgi:hypothetical protein